MASQLNLNPIKYKGKQISDIPSLRGEKKNISLTEFSKLLKLKTFQGTQEKEQFIKFIQQKYILTPVSKTKYNIKLIPQKDQQIIERAIEKSEKNQEKINLIQNNSGKIINLNSRKFTHSTGINKIIDNFILTKEYKSYNQLTFEIFKNCELFDIFLKTSVNNFSSELKYCIYNFIFLPLKQLIFNRVKNLRTKGIIDINFSYIISNGYDTQELSETQLRIFNILEPAFVLAGITKNEYDSLYGDNLIKFSKVLNQVLNADERFKNYKIKYRLINVQVLDETYLSKNNLELQENELENSLTLFYEYYQYKLKEKFKSTKKHGFGINDITKVIKSLNKLIDKFIYKNNTKHSKMEYSINSYREIELSPTLIQVFLSQLSPYKI